MAADALGESTWAAALAALRNANVDYTTRCGRREAFGQFSQARGVPLQAAPSPSCVHEHSSQYQHSHTRTRRHLPPSKRKLQPDYSLDEPDEHSNNACFWDARVSNAVGPLF